MAQALYQDRESYRWAANGCYLHPAGVLPSWFHIKSHPKFTSSHSNLHYQMELVMNQPEEVQQIVKPVIQRNVYFAEPSGLLYSMLESDDKALRQQAVDKIHQLELKNCMLPLISMLLC